MEVTVGVPAYKEPGISKCLKALKNEGVNEIIVVTPDNNTARIARREGVKVIKEKTRKGKPAAINKILKEASNELIVLTDADVIIKPGAIKELLKKMKKGVSVVCGHPVIINNNGMMGYWGELLYDIVHKQRLRGARHLTTNLCLIRRGCVKSIPENALIDDYVIGLECTKKGGFAYAPRAKVRVMFPTTISDFINQRARTFAGYMQVKDWYGDSERSLSQEASGLWLVLSYIKKPKHLVWVSLLILFRLIAWLKAYYLYKIKKSNINKIWVRIKSTKA